MQAGALRTLANASLVCSNSETAEEAAREGLKIAQEAPGDAQILRKFIRPGSYVRSVLAPSSDALRS